jgi:hypothetical protein
LIATTCATALVVAAVLLFAPGLLPVPPGLLANVASLLGATAIGGLIAIVGLYRGYTGRSAATPVRTPEQEPERRRPGTAFDDRLAAATTTDRVPEQKREHRVEQLRDELRELVIERYRQEKGVDREIAVEVVAEGTWTDDPVAAAYLGSETDDIPLRDWLRLLAHPQGSIHAQVERTVDALDGAFA